MCYSPKNHSLIAEEPRFLTDFQYPWYIAPVPKVIFISVLLSLHFLRIFIASYIDLVGQPHSNQVICIGINKNQLSDCYCDHYKRKSTEHFYLYFWYESYQIE